MTTTVESVKQKELTEQLLTAYVRNIKDETLSMFFEKQLLQNIIQLRYYELTQSIPQELCTAHKIQDKFILINVSKTLRLGDKQKDETQIKD